MNELPILYSFRRCPYAMRARMALAVSGEVVEIREVMLADKPPALITASPKATVPVLVLGDGTVVDQSLDIMRWALRANDPEGWLAGDDDALIATIDGPFKQHLERYKYPERYPDDRDTHRDAAVAILEGFEARLAVQGHLCGADRSLADIAAMPFVRQFAEVDRGWFDVLPLPNLHRWLAGLIGSALFERTMVRLPQWREGAPTTLFPAGV